MAVVSPQIQASSRHHWRRWWRRRWGWRWSRRAARRRFRRCWCTDRAEFTFTLRSPSQASSMMLSNITVEIVQCFNPQLHPFSMRRILFFEFFQHPVGIELRGISHIFDMWTGRGRDQNPRQCRNTFRYGGKMIEQWGFTITTGETYVHIDQKERLSLSTQIYRWLLRFHSIEAWWRP